MKRNLKEPVLVLANGVGLWRHYDDAGGLTYGVRQVSGDKKDEIEIRMTPEEWELLLGTIKTDQFNEEGLERKDRYRALPPIPPLPPTAR